LKLNGKHQLLVYADDVNVLGGSVYTIKENAEPLVMSSRSLLEVSDQPKNMVISRDQNAGRSHSIKIDNRMFVF